MLTFSQYHIWKWLCQFHYFPKLFIEPQILVHVGMAHPTLHYTLMNQMMTVLLCWLTSVHSTHIWIKACRLWSGMAVALTGCLIIHHTTNTKCCACCTLLHRMANALHIPPSDSHRSQGDSLCRWKAIQESGHLSRMKRTHIHFATLPSQLRKNQWATVLLQLDTQVRSRMLSSMPACL